MYCQPPGKGGPRNLRQFRVVIEYGFRKAAPVVIPGTDKQDPVVHEHGISQYADNSTVLARKSHKCPVPEISISFVAIKNGPPTRRSEPDWQLEGAYPERYVTDERRCRRPIFIATLWAAASWPFFRVARSSRIDLDMLVARALKNSQLTCGERHAYFGDRTLG